MIDVRCSGAAREWGYSALELLVTISVLAIVSAVAIPGLSDFVMRGRLATQANELIGAFNFARSEAVTRGTPVSLCPAAAPYTACANSPTWTSGWIVFTDAAGTAGTVDAGDEVIRVFQGLDGGNTLSTAATRSVQYLPTGFLAAAAGPFTLRAGNCVGDGVRTIALSLQGRPDLDYGACT